MLMPLELRHYSWKQSTINDNHEDRIQLIAFMQVAVAFDRIIATEIPNDFIFFVDAGALFVAYIKFVAVENLKNLYCDQRVDQG